MGGLDSPPFFLYGLDIVNQWRYPMPYADPEKRRQALRDWRARNPEKQKAINARAAEGDRLYRLAHKDQYAQYQQNSRRRNPRQHLLSDAKGRAKRAGIPFTVTIDDITWVTHCPILGVELAYIKGDGKVRTNSATLDRRTNDLGYVPGNVFVLSHRANRLKSDATILEIEAILRYMRG
jgi:hypothetical protein